MEQEKSNLTPAQTFEEIKEELRIKLRTLQKNKQLDDLDAEVLFDPWDSQDPFAIIGNIPPDSKYPMGQALAWKNPRLRTQSANIGWKGWIPLEYGDPYTGENGEMLTDYLQEAPARLEGTTQLDNMVRRGDAVLCRLDMRAWIRRQIDREAKSLEMRNALRQVSEDEARVGISGEGLMDQKVPRGGFRPQDNEVPGGKNLIMRSGPTKRSTSSKED